MIYPRSLCKRIVESYNWINICGLKGDGKTRLAIEISELFLKDGFRLLTNVKTIWADDPEKVDLLSDGSLRAVIILDEGGWYVRTLETISKILVESNKMSVVWLSPSVQLPHEELWGCVFYPIINFGMVILWKIQIVTIATITSNKPKVYYILQIVSKIAQEVYKTSAPGYRPEGLLSKFDLWTSNYLRRYDIEEYKLSDLARPDSIRTAGLAGSLSRYSSIVSTPSKSSDGSKARKG